MKIEDKRKKSDFLLPLLNILFYILTIVCMMSMILYHRINKTEDIKWQNVARKWQNLREMSILEEKVFLDDIIYSMARIPVPEAVQNTPLKKPTKNVEL
ncbi:MAG: hypothetical protein LBD11_03680 [Candidatus Peribacteria bacterium]|jgi:hypothetical protein|nr:hypothetical protein [Candidatus Peribacteria bacterium]